MVTKGCNFNDWVISYDFLLFICEKLSPSCSLYDLLEQGQIDQNTNLSTLGHPFISTSASLTPLASDCQIIATHQPLENIGNLKVLDKLIFQRMITRPGVAGAVLKHLCCLLTD